MLKMTACRSKPVQKQRRVNAGISMERLEKSPFVLAFAGQDRQGFLGATHGSCVPRNMIGTDKDLDRVPAPMLGFSAVGFWGGQL
jgi:hypothetical protein